MQPLSNLYIYLTDLCNLRCLHCWQTAPLITDRSCTYLQFSRCRDFLDKARELGLRSVTLSGGEPLLSPAFHEFAEYFHTHGITCALETNGILISGPRLGSIRRFNVFCAISLDGRTPETHNHQRGRPDAFERTVNGMKALETEGIQYQLIMAISKANQHELFPLMDWVRNQWKLCNSFKVNVIWAAGRAASMDDSGLLLTPSEQAQLGRELHRVSGQYPFRVMLHANPVFFSHKALVDGLCCGGRCGFESALSILANGEVSICSLGKHYDEYAFGRVDDIDLSAVWHSNPVLRKTHEDSYKNLQGVCANCILKKMCCGGCRAQALAVFGDVFAPAPACQQYFDSGLFPQSHLIGISH